MDPNFDYASVPERFAHCLNAGCARAGQCLRQLVVAHVPADRPTFTVINNAPHRPDGEDCPYFKPDQPLRYAKGMTHLLDNLPHKKAEAIHSHLLHHFGRSQLSRARRGTILISPADQAYIKQLFSQYDIADEPAFDSYVYEYNWLASVFPASTRKKKSV